MSVPSFYIINGTINDSINVEASFNSISVIFYNYSNERAIDTENPLRIIIQSNITSINSILVIIKDDNSVVSSIEMWKQFKQPTVTASRTICPVSNCLNCMLSVEISSQSLQPISVTIHVFILSNFLLKLNDSRNVTISKNNPNYFLFKFNPDVGSVAVNVESYDEICMILSIQHAVCPVNDNIMSVKYSGIYQTVLQKGSMIVQKTRNFDSQFFIVFILNNNDESCLGGNIINIMTKNSSIREKNFTLSIQSIKGDYLFPIFGAIGFYLLFYVISPLISFIYNYCCLRNFQTEVTLEEHLNISTENLCGSLNEIADMHSISANKNSILHRYMERDTGGSSNTSYNIAVESNGESNDSISDVSTDRNIWRFNKIIYVSDLSQKNSAILDRKYFLYLWYLVIISVFYALPVVQLVINYQQTFDDTGNQDICYYNFQCTRPLFIFTAFNNIISNVGYVLLGILFTLITWRRHRLYNECRLSQNKNKKDYGIPQYYGLFYAMGVSLTMEGIMSACYHICPSHNNFQFDTAYMYILACLCMIKVYQIRHPDINATAHSFFMIMALFIFVGVVGVVYNRLAFWCIFTILYLLLSLFLTLEVYYLGKWKVDFELPVRIYFKILNNKWKSFIPIFKIRMIILIVVNVTNISFALYGAFEQPSNFSSHFLAIFMTNLLLYFLIYIIMKMIYCERFYHLSIIYIMTSIVCWAFSIYCFIKYPTDWQETPSRSREHNQNCILLNFYDIHDVWHFLSSLAMFFSFMALQNIDDSLFQVERNKIPVF